MAFSYVYPRSVLYAFLWIVSLIELGLTGYRVHHTKSSAGFYDPIVVELLVTAVLTLLCVPATIFAHLRKAKDLTPSEGYTPLYGESAGNGVLWVLWLVGAAIATHKWPNKTLAGTDKHAHVLLTLVAFAWLAFIALSFVMILVLLQYAALAAVGSYDSPKKEESPKATTEKVPSPETA